MPIIAGTDLETTGLFQEKGARIIEVCILSYDLDTRKLVDRYVQRIDPRCPIEPGAQAVHKIAYTDLIGEPEWPAVAPEVFKRLAACDLMVIHNAGFDGPFLAAEFIRIGMPVPDVSAYCTKENARWACMDGKYPKLGELCFALNIPYDPSLAHSAEYDVDRMMQCYFSALDRGFFTAPVTTTKSIDAFANRYTDTDSSTKEATL